MHESSFYWGAGCTQVLPFKGLRLDPLQWEHFCATITLQEFINCMHPASIAVEEETVFSSIQHLLNPRATKLYFATSATKGGW